MFTNPKSYAGFQGKYPLLVSLDSDVTPPMLENPCWIGNFSNFGVL